MFAVWQLHLRRRTLRPVVADLSHQLALPTLMPVSSEASAVPAMSENFDILTAIWIAKSAD